MKIQCTIERQGGSEVTFTASKDWPAGAYHFKPDTTQPGAPHLAEVPVEAHIHRLLSIPGYRAYVEQGGESESAAPKRPSAAGVPRPNAPAPTNGEGGAIVPPKGGESEPAAGQGAGEGSAGADGEQPPVDPIVAEILELTVANLKATINKYPREALQLALAGEKARTDDPPRKGFIAVIEAHLGVEG